MKTIRINTNNYSGYTGDITFYPYTGGTINIGPQVLPYDYNTDYYYGIYEIFISVFNKTCVLDYSPPACDFSGSVNTTSFISTWKTDNEGYTGPDQIGIFLDSLGTFDFVIDWGDGSSDYINNPSQPELVHTYSSIGTYTIIMTGIIDGFTVGNFSGDYGKILNVEQWGNVKLIDGGYQFYYCYNLDLSTVNDILDTSNLTNITNMFGECYSLVGVNNIELWDISNFTSLEGLFVLTQFNQDLNSWDVSNIADMSGMFYNTPFNQPLSSWDVKNVQDMSYMFSFTPFDQYIGDWDVSSVLSMTNMFQDTVFNQPISGWNVSNVINMDYMFYNSQFNQPIDLWDVSGVQSMAFMFYNSLFDQQLSGWNVSSVSNMNYMFSNSSFNQNIGNWNISGVTNFIGFMEGKTPATLSTTNLDAIYNGWSTKNPQSNINITFGTAKYTLASSSGRGVLTGTYNWTITDGGI